MGSNVFLRGRSTVVEVQTVDGQSLELTLPLPGRELTSVLESHYERSFTLLEGMESAKLLDRFKIGREAREWQKEVEELILSHVTGAKWNGEAVGTTTEAIVQELRDGAVLREKGVPMSVVSGWLFRGASAPGGADPAGDSGNLSPGQPGGSHGGGEEATESSDDGDGERAVPQSLKGYLLGGNGRQV